MNSAMSEHIQYMHFVCKKQNVWRQLDPRVVQL